MVLCTVLILATAATLAHVWFREPPRGTNLTPEEWHWLSLHDGKLRLGTDPQYHPISFIDNNGVHQGISEDYFKLIEKRLNISFLRVNPTTWHELLNKLRNKEIDLTGEIQKTPERMEYLLFTQPYINVPNMIFVRSDRTDSLTMSDLSGMNVAVTRNYAVENHIRENYPQIRTVPGDCSHNGVMKLSIGEVDAFIGELPIVSHIISEQKITNLRIAGDAGLTYNLTIASRSDLPILNSILTKVLATITEEERREIHDRWISIEYNKFLFSSRFWHLTIAGFSIVLAAALAVSIWNKTMYRMVNERTNELVRYKEKLEEMVAEKTKELTVALIQLEAAASTDPLTHLSNRRNFEILLKNELLKAKRYFLPLTLLFLDIDHFKRINDDFGHNIGDDVLEDIASIIKASIRDTDIAARWGGEEFIALLTVTNLEAGLICAEKIRKAVESYTFSNINRQITVSIGVAEFNTHESITSWINRADGCLYQAKNEGRNCVRPQTEHKGP